ncbi:MAG: hypothetical protein Q3983_02410 [Capnocytophaga sp.]|nr:hypothetical protein [Capnocytophaga sp.]
MEKNTISLQDISPKLQEILAKSNTPISWLKELKNIGLQTAKNAFKYILVFIVLFFLFITIGSYILFTKEVKTTINITGLVLVYMVGVGFIFLSFYRLYVALQMETAQFAYLQSRSLVEKICYKIITKVEEKMSGIISMSEIKKIIFTLTAGFPKILGKILTFVLERVPMGSILIEIFDKNNFNTTNERTNYLYNKVDDFAIHFFEEGKSSNWFVKTLIWNILVQSILLFIIFYF